MTRKGLPAQPPKASVFIDNENDSVFPSAQDTAQGLVLDDDDKLNYV